MSKTLWLFLFILLFSTSQAQGIADSTRYLTLKDTIFLSVGPYGIKIYEHQMKADQTLFSLARFYGMSVDELYFYNPELRSGVVDIGQKIRIPIPNRAILRFQSPPFGTLNYSYVPVFYRVRKGDTLFRISKYFFRMPVDTIRAWNYLWDDALEPGQCLHVGWMNIQGIPREYRKNMEDPLSRRNSSLREYYFQAVGQQKEYDQQGVAFWKKDGKASSDFYALHRSAPENSVIEVFNPMTNRRIYARVIGKIPDRTYDDNVIVVLSPLSATALGAKDQRFFVRVTYLK